MHAPDAEHAVPVAYNCAGNDAARAAPLRLPEEHWDRIEKWLNERSKRLSRRRPTTGRTPRQYEREQRGLARHVFQLASLCLIDHFHHEDDR